MISKSVKDIEKETGVTSTNNHIYEYLERNEMNNQEKASKEIFNADENNIDLRTHLDDFEISKISSMKMIDKILKSRGLSTQFNKFYDPYLRLKVSKDRLSRSEFVSINKQDTSGDIVEGMKTASGILGGK
jgi:hypothetical protein